VGEVGVEEVEQGWDLGLFCFCFLVSWIRARVRGNPIAFAVAVTCSVFVVLG